MTHFVRRNLHPTAPDPISLIWATPSDEPDADSSSLPSSSPVRPTSQARYLLEGEYAEEELGEYDYDDDPLPQMNDAEKVLAVLNYMKITFKQRFSLRCFLETLFGSDHAQINQSRGIFLSDGGHIMMMDLWWKDQQSNGMVDWVVEKAAYLCAKKASRLTNRASSGLNMNDASFLRVPASKVSVLMLNEFRLSKLTGIYDRSTPHLQSILKGVIGKEEKALKPESRNPNAGRTMATSILLNLRSRELNYHPIINTLIFWDNRVPKRFTQAFNRYGITMSCRSQTVAIRCLGRDSLAQARNAANDEKIMKMLVYDNFNWIEKAWEATAMHRSLVHDEVSAMLIILDVPKGLNKSASDITNLAAFSECAGTRHKLSLEISLTDILPSSSDQKSFRLSCISHIAKILSDEVASFHNYRDFIPKIEDIHAIEAAKTKEHYLPTFDQEQGSTRGNMIILEHYFGKVLAIPKSSFENTMYTVLGNRLTTARDRAAQDQRAVDRSTQKFDHFSSLSMSSGLMHFVLNFLQAIGRNTWGSATGGALDAVSLASLRDALPNRGEINLRKVDYYAWLRFLDVILRSLVVRAAMVLRHASSFKELSETRIEGGFSNLCQQIVDRFLMPSIDRLEADGYKSTLGHTESGHAVLLLHDLMTIHEVQDSIKHGHPTCIKQMLKYWTPMFYAVGSYNYANESMELLHNLIHDWPSDYAATVLNGMVVNSSGNPDGFKAADLRIEHLNGQIKEHTHGPNASPALLEKITPVLGSIQQLTDQLYDELGVERQNQKHREVSRHRDVEILVEYLTQHNIFDFKNDKPSKHIVTDLYCSGCIRLSGTGGGHARHLERHKLRLRTRHSTTSDDGRDPELGCAFDIHPVDFSILDHSEIESDIVLNRFIMAGVEEIDGEGFSEEEDTD